MYGRGKNREVAAPESCKVKLIIPPDQAAFLSDNFDVNGYAKAVLAGQTYRPDDPNEAEGASQQKDAHAGRGDIGVELAKLNQGIVSLSRGVALNDTPSRS